jgi:uncharacterized OB-fold protein
MLYEAELAKPFENGIREQRLVLPRCADCGHFHWYPMRLCPHCLSSEIVWHGVDPKGTIFTHTTVRHAFSSSRDESQTPYDVALVELPGARGVRLVAEVVGASKNTIAIGMPVTAVFEATGERPRIAFTPSDVAQGSNT